MENRSKEAERQTELKCGATRERVPKHRATHNVQPTASRQPPKLTQERPHQSCLRKKQLRIAISANQSNEIVLDRAALATHATSMERTRQYRQRLRQWSCYLKPMPLSQSECNRKCYAKQQQCRLRSQGAEIVQAHIGSYPTILLNSLELRLMHS